MVSGTATNGLVYTFTNTGTGAYRLGFLGHRPGACGLDGADHDEHDGVGRDRLHDGDGHSRWLRSMDHHRAPVQWLCQWKNVHPQLRKLDQPS